MNGEITKQVEFFKKKSAIRNNINHSVEHHKKSKKSDTSQDIYEMHHRILKLLNDEYEQLTDLKQRYSRLEWISKNSDTLLERQQANQELAKLRTQIQLIESGFREAKYILATEKILVKYNEILKEPIKIDFMGNKNSDQHQRKQIIINEFLNVAKDYIPIQPIEAVQQNILCEECEIELQKEDDFLFVCPICGFAIKQFASVASYQENNRINIAQRYVYDKRAHFGDSIKKFQATQNTTISAQVYKDLWEKIGSHDIAIEKLTPDHVYEFLKLSGHSDHYEDITLIYCEMTKKPPPNISHLEQQLYTLFDQVDLVYERVKPAGRVNFLNGQFVLFKLLQKLKYPCREEDFYILKTREKMLEHDQIWKKICQELSWTYISTV